MPDQVSLRYQQEFSMSSAAGQQIVRIGLISQTSSADDATVKAVAAAIDIQLKCHVGPRWKVSGTVEAFPFCTHPPAGVSPIFIVENTPNHVGGLHTTTDGGLPWAIVLVSRDWHVAASHEAIELLIDPTGNRMQESSSIQIAPDGSVQDGTDRVKYIVEACDPLEDGSYTYPINGIAVSDFYTPAYFDAAVTPGTEYSFNGALTRPREVKPNGYISWMSSDGRLHQLRWFGKPEIFDLPDHSAATTQDGQPLSHREFIDQHTHTPRKRELHPWLK
jgi:hypothetical protein